MAPRSARTALAPAAAPAGEIAIPTQLWPLVALSVGLPPLFLLGLASVAWALPGLVFGAALLRRRTVRSVPGAGLLLALVAWVALSGLQVSGVPSLALFAHRWSLFLAVALTFLWLCDTPREVVSDAAVIRVVGWTWPVLIAFGYLAFIFPDVSTASPLLRLLPAGVGAQPAAIDLSSLRFAEIQEFLGYPVPRPAAPFAYANTWGSAVALTFPFFVLDRLVGQSRARQRVGLLILAVGIIPVVVSLNRGLWLCLGAAVGYAAVRRATVGDLRTAARLVAVGAVVVGAVLLSPLGGLISDRFERAEDSNETRGSVAVEAIVQGVDSPLLGFGAPGEAVDGGVAVGTHGLLWYLIYSHGFVAAGLFVAWLLGALRRGLRLATTTGIWMTAVLLMAVVQLPIYTILPHVVLVAVAGGLVWRSRQESRQFTSNR